MSYFTFVAYFPAAFPVGSTETVSMIKVFLAATSTGHERIDFFFKAAPNDGSLRFQCSKTQRGCTQGPLHCVVFLLLNHPLNYSLKCLLIKSALLLAVTPTKLAADILYVTSQDVSSVIS